MPAVPDPAAQRTPPSPATISRIAVGVDGQPEGNDAGVLGKALADVMQADLLLVAVHPDPLVVLPEERNWRSLEEQAASLLGETCDSFAPGARAVVETDMSVPRGLERVVRREDRDLLVVGSSRHGADGRVRIGKRTRQLLGHCKCALAIAPRGIHGKHRRGLTAVGVGYDGGPESDEAVALAGSIALAAGAKLHLCGVVDDRLSSIGWSALAADGAVLARREEAVRAEMDALGDFGLSAAKATGASVRAEIRRGRPADALLKPQSTA